VKASGGELERNIIERRLLKKRRRSELLITMAKYQWILIFYHACKEISRVYSETLFDSKVECQLDGERVMDDTDCCCGCSLEVIAI
jgi:hypothetical protein